MFGKYLVSAAAVAALSATSILVQAQTFTDCNPLERACPPDPALAGTSRTDFTKGEDQSFFKVIFGTDLEYDGDKGATFSITKDNDAPTVASHKYIFFGKVDVVLQAAPGAGIVTSVVLQSDDLDEIDWEWIGSDPDQVQTNYYSKGNTATYDRGRYHPVSATSSQFHTYTLEWTADAITWSVNGDVIRVVTYADAYNGHTYPQTPMQLKLGTWVAGKADTSQGTIDWAGGMADFSKGPFLAYYQSVTVTDYSNGVEGATQYIYGDHSGTWESIIVDTTGNGKDDDDDNKHTTAKAHPTTKASTLSTKTKTSTISTAAKSTGTAATVTSRTSVPSATGTSKKDAKSATSTATETSEQETKGATSTATSTPVSTETMQPAAAPRMGSGSTTASLAITFSGLLFFAHLFL